MTGDSKVYNNYIDYTKITDQGDNIIKKNNLQPSIVGDILLETDNETLSSASPAIDQGLNPTSETFKSLIDNETTYNEILNYLQTDKNGNPRVHNGTIDMGAVEYSAN